MEHYNNHAIDKIEHTTGLDKPEDILQSSDEVSIDKRERLFEKEGRFRQMLALKATLEYLGTNVRGFLGTGVSTVGEALYGSPKTLRSHAYSMLGVPSDQTETISEDELKRLRGEYMEKSRVRFLEEINMYITEMAKYEAAQKSGTFRVALGQLEQMKTFIAQDRWEDLTYAQVELQGNLSGIKQILRLMLGDQSENDYVRQKVNLPTQEEADRRSQQK